MDIYLIQHAQSKSKDEDPERSLTDEGWKTFERVAAHCAEMDINLNWIYHSGKLRAQQTAEILATHLGAKSRVQTQHGLAPLDDVKPTRNWLAQQSQQGLKALAIVGHLPFLDKLASLPVTGNEEANIVAFQHAGIVKLSPKSQDDGYAIQWVLTPELATARHA